MPILSANKKTGVSLNLPSSNCRPTSICKFCCYGRHHYLGHGRAAQAKWARNSQYLAQTPDCHELIEEARAFSAVRISGIGDILPAHIKNLLILAKSCPMTQFWGMTRKPELAKKINGAGLPNLSMLVTVDATSPRRVWDEYQGRMCFGPRRAQDNVPEDRRLVTVFPYHNSGKIVGQVPEHPLDCPAVRHKVSGCLECGRCWKWEP
jgi:hypothetical protein